MSRPTSRADHPPPPCPPSSDGVFCVICQDCAPEGGFIPLARSELQCGHRFHVDCIVQWFRGGNRQCPLCMDDDGFLLGKQEI